MKTGIRALKIHVMKPSVVRPHGSARTLAEMERVRKGKRAPPARRIAGRVLKSVAMEIAMRPRTAPHVSRTAVLVQTPVEMGYVPIQKDVEAARKIAEIVR